MNGHHSGTGRVPEDARNPQTPSTGSDDSDDGDDREWRASNFSHAPHGANKRFKVSWDNPRYPRYGGVYNEFGGFGFSGRDRSTRDREYQRQRQREIFLSAPPALHRGCPKALCFWSQSEEREYLILSSSFTHSDGGAIYKYDVWNDVWDRFRKYNNGTFQPYNCGHAIHNKTNQLYIFGGVHKTFGVFDVEKGTEKIYDITKHKDMTYWYPVSLFIQNELHILAEINGRALHSTYVPSKSQITKHFLDMNKKEELIDYSQDEQEMHDRTPIFSGCKLVYVQHTKEMLLFNGCNNIYIWSYAFGGDRKWRLWRAKNGKYIVLPKKNTNNFDVQIVHDEIVLICYLSTKQTWAKNIKKERNDAKWYRKNVKQFMGITQDSQMLTSIDNHYVHFINTITPKHCMVWMYLLLPRRISKRFYVPMIAANYLRQLLLKKNKKVEIAQNILTLVSNYCANVLY